MGLHSTRQHAGRGVDVYLPPGYDESRADAYPLLLLHDGQNLFDPERAHGGQPWQVGEAIDHLVTTGVLPPLVVAGIDHAAEGRVAEFTPTPGRDDVGGGATTYAAFLVRDLLPALTAAYHVRTDFEGLGLGGSSMGGLVTLVAASSFPGTFGRLLVMSPSIWWDRRLILRLIERDPLDPAPRVWLDAGTLEGRAVVRDARALRTLLRRQRVPVQYVEDPEGDHSERSWARRLPAALEWLFSAGAPTASPPTRARA